MIKNKVKTTKNTVQVIIPNSYVYEEHRLPKVLNSHIHPTYLYFMDMTNEDRAKRYVQMFPYADINEVKEVLNYKPKYMKWGGCDLIHATTDDNGSRMMVIETNSCPMGQNSMPVLDSRNTYGGYLRMMKQSFGPAVEKISKETGVLAVIYDKNSMENSAYAKAMATYFNEKVYFVSHYVDADTSRVRERDGYLEILDDKEWKRVRAAFRYVTQKPWTRLPLTSKTYIHSPVLACIAGGRNKLIAAKAYEIENNKYDEGVKINFPHTYVDVSKEEIPDLVKKLGNKAVVKIPYGNCGLGVFTILTKKELDSFMSRDEEYDRYIVQALIGARGSSSVVNEKETYHVGTMPDQFGESYAFDLRLVVISTQDGFVPLGSYSRKTKLPLSTKITSGLDSWQVLGTNLSFKNPDGSWNLDQSKMLAMDDRDFNKLGMGIDQLIDGYVQACMSVKAIDEMAKNLVKNGDFDEERFRELNDDSALIREITETH